MIYYLINVVRGRIIFFLKYIVWNFHEIGRAFINIYINGQWYAPKFQ